MSTKKSPEDVFENVKLIKEWNKKEKPSTSRRILNVVSKYNFWEWRAVNYIEDYSWEDSNYSS